MICLKAALCAAPVEYQETESNSEDLQVAQAAFRSGDSHAELRFNTDGCIGTLNL